MGIHRAGEVHGHKDVEADLASCLGQRHRRAWSGLLIKVGRELIDVLDLQAVQPNQRATASRTGVTAKSAITTSTTAATRSRTWPGPLLR